MREEEGRGGAKISRLIVRTSSLDAKSVPEKERERERDGERSNSNNKSDLLSLPGEERERGRERRRERGEEELRFNGGTDYQVQLFLWSKQCTAPWLA